LFCGAGGASEGYRQSGFEVIGVDIAPQPHYPFEFWQTDALDVLAMGGVGTWLLEDFSAFHASPPCQAFSDLQKQSKREYPDLDYANSGLSSCI
jgi:DNA (cytosine-5)-methyltransferase 1